MQIVESFPNRVREIPNVFVPLSSGERLAARLWLPDAAGGARVPAILDFFIYRKSDFTCARDSTHYEYLACHGYGCVKVDCRGTGDSDGLLTDQFARQHVDDMLETLRWIAAQPWCDGRVGMMGLSWPGHAALMAAARRPPELKALVPMDAADDRYLNRFQGGCLLLYTAIWGPAMASMSARPPRPVAVGDRWREMWRERVEGTPQYLATWLAHPWSDDYWAEGSMADAYGQIACPVYYMVGWSDPGYAITTPRLLARMTAPSRALAGPWGHRFPHYALPGPGIDGLGEIRRWFDQCLKGIETGIHDEPKLRAYMFRSAPPDPAARELPGRWVAEPDWPAGPMRRFAFAPGRLGGAGEAGEVSVRTPLTHGFASGEWMPWYPTGVSAELSGDQRVDDAVSAVFDGAPLDQPLALLGTPELELDLAADAPEAQLVVRLCDVAPDGVSRRITFALLDLRHRDGDAAPAPIVPGQRMKFRLPLYPTGWEMAAGHRLRIAVATSYWPVIWPSRQRATLTLFTEGCALHLPERQARPEDASARDLGRPAAARGVPTEALAPPRSSRRLIQDVATGETVLEIEDDGGRTLIKDRDIEVASASTRRFAIRPEDPLSPRVDTTWRWEVREGDWHTVTEVDATITADAEQFHVRTRIRTFELDWHRNAAPAFAREWTESVARDGA